MNTSRIVATTIRLLPVLVVGITLAAAGDAFAGNARSGSGNTEAKAPSRMGTALLVERPAPGGPIGKPLPPVRIDHGRGDPRMGHGHADRYRYYYERRHRHSRYESPPIFGKRPEYTSRQSDLFRRGVVGPQPGG